MEKITIKERNEAAIELQRMWELLISAESPSMAQFYRWLDLHHIFRIAQAIIKTSEKEEHMADQNKVMTLDHAVRWTSSIANALKTEEEEDTMTTETPNTETQKNPFPRLPEQYHVERTVETPKIATDETTGALTPSEVK